MTKESGGVLAAATKQLVIEIIKWGWPFILSGTACILAWINGIDAIAIPVWLLLLIVPLVITLLLLTWRAYWTWQYDDDDVVAHLIPWLAQKTWFGLGTKQYLSTAITYSSVDRRFRFPRGSTKRMLDKAMLHYGFVPVSKGENVATYHFKSASISRRDDGWVT
jgi:hypothetical protein